MLINILKKSIKGSIKEERKHADLIILDKNPCKVEIDEILDINILMTIKNGKVIYQK